MSTGLIEECSRELLEGAKIVAPTLKPFGFAFRPEYADVSSAGPFANAFFFSDRLQIGLIVRAKRGLGAVIYEAGQYQAAHNELLTALGCADRASLFYDEQSMSSRARDGGDPFAALNEDLRDLFLPIWVHQTTKVELTIRRLREQWLRKLGIQPPQPNSG